MTLSKLSFRNAKRQTGDYLIYFTTIVLAAALLYAFNGLTFSSELLTLSKFMETLPMMIVFASIVVVCIFGWLVSYATGFMLSRYFAFSLFMSLSFYPCLLFKSSRTYLYLFYFYLSFSPF